MKDLNEKRRILKKLKSKYPEKTEEDWYKVITFWEAGYIKIKFIPAIGTPEETIVVYPTENAPEGIEKRFKEAWLQVFNKKEDE